MPTESMPSSTRLPRFLRRKVGNSEQESGGEEEGSWFETSGGPRFAKLRNAATLNRFVT